MQGHLKQWRNRSLAIMGLFCGFAESTSDWPARSRSPSRKIMKEGIHPNYREVLFVDLSNGFKFVTRSCVNTGKPKPSKAKEYPLFKLDTS